MLKGLIIAGFNITCTDLPSYWLDYGYWYDVGKSIVVLSFYDPCGPLIFNYSACMQAPEMVKYYELVTSQGNWIQ